ncbi:MAG: hypothetical protein EHM28_03890 [Spirochaetaceae bacterium]|nr:MAG: hypothetical protein EHM28_03890 [Spirochaetaceae bacterium]
MKKNIFALIVLLCAVSGFALDFDGEFATETRVDLTDKSYFFNQENGKLTFEQQVDDNLFARASMKFRYFNSPMGLQSGGSLLTPSELSILSSIGPVEISLDEAFFTFTDLILPGLDISVGKQRIPWGTADVLNPTDVLNPLDLSDPFDFGKKTPSISMTLSYTIPETDVYFLVVAEPFSQIARLNPMITAQMEAAMIQAPITGFNDDPANPVMKTVLTPAAELENGLVAVKTGFQVADFDLSVSYATRISDMPLVSNITFDGTDILTPPDPVPITDYSLSYFREHMIGADVVKDWGIFLMWAEVALFFQQEQMATTTIVGGPLAGTTTSTALASDLYVKYTVGMDKDFGGGFYMNFQYAHGFFTERGNEGAGRLQDYILLRLQYDTLEEKLTFGLTGLLNVNTIADTFTASDIGEYFTDNFGFMTGLDVEYKPSLSLTLKVGIMFFEGEDSTHIGKMDGYDMFYFKAEFKF